MININMGVIQSSILSRFIPPEKIRQKTVATNESDRKSGCIERIVKIMADEK